MKNSISDSVKEFLEENRIQYTVSDDGRVMIEGDLYLSSLTSVPEGFSPTAGGDLYLRSLTSVPEGFNPTAGGDLWLDSLTSVPEGFNPTAGGDLDLRSLTSVPEGFNPTVGGTLDLSSLTSAPEGFNPTAGRDLDLSSLTSVPEGFSPTAGGAIYLNSLTSVPEGFSPTAGGAIYLGRECGIKTGGLPEKFNEKLRADLELKFNIKGFTIADGILARIIHSRGALKKVMICGQTKTSWLASDDKGNHAHGDTMREAREELAFKTGDRDVSQYRNLPLDIVKTPKEWAFVYRNITGACGQGTKMFMARQKLKKSYTLSEIIAATNGAYGHESFVRCVKGD